MSFSHIATYSDDTGSNSGDTNTITGVSCNDGDLLVCFCGWEADTTVSVSDGGSNDFTMEAVTDEGTSYATMGYVLDASSVTNQTFTMTLGSNGTWRVFGLMVFRPDADETVTHDGYNAATGSGTAIQSGDVDPTGTDIVAAGFGYHYTSLIATDHQLYEVGDDGYVDPDIYSTMAYKLFTADQSSGHFQCTAIAGNNWVSGIIAFKSEAAGGATEVTKDGTMAATGESLRLLEAARNLSGEL